MIPNPTSIFQIPSSGLRRFRIGFDAKRAFNNVTGLGNYSRFVISGMIRYFPENEYFLFTPSISKEFEKFVEPLPNVHTISPENLFNKTFRSAWRSFSIPEIINQYKLDVFHGLSNELPIGIENVTAKKIVTIHDLIFMRNPDYYNNIDRFIYKRKFKHACENADLVLAASLQTRRDVMEYFGTMGSRVQVAYQDCNPLYTEQWSEEKKKEIRAKYNLPEKFILSVGTIEQRKNQLTILKAFHYLNEPGMNLLFIGNETSYSKLLHQFAESNGITDRVKFIRLKDYNDLSVIYQCSEMLVYASEFEGFGIPVLEGMRSGVPVIAADTSSLPEVGGSAAEYFKFNNVNQLTEKLKLVLHDSSKRKAMIENGFRQAAMFDGEKLIREMMKVYLS